MAKKKYLVTIPWFGKEKGDTVEFDEVPAAVKANVMLLSDAEKNDGSDLVEQAKAEAEKIKEEAEAEKSKLLDEAKAEAEKIKADAETEANKLIEDATKQAGELTPATPKAATKK